MGIAIKEYDGKIYFSKQMKGQIWATFISLYIATVMNFRIAIVLTYQYNNSRTKFFVLITGFGYTIIELAVVILLT